MNKKVSPVAIYISTHHGMMGNNYYYMVGEDNYYLAIRILGSPETIVFKNQEQIALYAGNRNKERIMPEEAFRILGIETDGKRPIEKWEFFGSPLESSRWDVR